MRHWLSAALAAFVFMVPARAEIMVHNAVVNLGIGERPASMHGHIMNKSGRDLQLVAADSAAFDRIELHTHEMSDGMMRMVKVERYEVPAKGGLMLKAGGEHLMLFGFTGQAGDAVDVTLRFADGTETTVSAPTKARKKHGGMSKGHGHHGH